LNDGTPIALGDGLFFRALMKFETLDRGQSERRKRYRITTREYIYEITGPKSQQDISAHWHPLARNSRFADPQSTKVQILSSELHGQALLAAKRPELQPLIDHVCEVAHGRDDIRTECAGSHCRRVVASKERRGHEAIAAGLLMLAGHTDLDELDRWMHVGSERRRGSTSEFGYYGS